jgi:hypothetical protein
MPLEKAEEARRTEDEPEADDLHPRLAGARASKTKRRD